MKRPKKPADSAPKKSPKKIRNYLLAAGVVAAVVIVAAVFLTFQPSSPKDEATRFQEAGALYTKSVDLANAGNYSEALSDADQALALNATSLIPLIQANRAGILVELGRNNDAITAADAALSFKGNLTTLQSIAWFNKGNALRNLGRLDDARAAYANATALDPTLKPPVF
jgi:tetratricopeptide (TPR) repeat protein